MRPDLVAVLSDSSLRDHTEECTLLLSRSFPDEQRPEWVETFSKEALQADEAPEAEAPAKARDIVVKLVQATPGLVEGTDREMEGLFNLLMSLVAKYVQEDDETYAKCFRHLARVVGDASSPAASERSVVKYRILANLFNTLSTNSPLRLEMFETLLALASTNGDMDFMEAALQTLPTWLTEWDVSMEEKEACLARVAEALQTEECGPEYVDKAYEYELLHLRFLSGESSLSKDRRVMAAETALANILRLPKLFEMEEVLHVPVTTELGASPILTLLKIVVGGTRADYEAWAKSSEGSQTLQKLSLSDDELRRKMRLLDLASLCARSVSSEVSYEDMAKVLDVPVDDVESWVIDVIRAGLVSGKLSQVTQSFRVYRSTYRAFEKAQWELLEQRLTQWQSSIQKLLTTMSQAPTQVPTALADEAQATA